MSKSPTTGRSPLDNFHSDELRAELARRDAITEDAVRLYKAMIDSRTTAPLCECGGPPCRTCPEVSCRWMTRLDWHREMERQIAAKDAETDG